MTVSLAVEGEPAGYRYSNRGTVSVLPDGTTTWLEGGAGPHRITTRTRGANEIAEHLDVMLSRQPRSAGRD